MAHVTSFYDRFWLIHGSWEHQHFLILNFISIFKLIGLLDIPIWLQTTLFVLWQDFYAPGSNDRGILFCPVCLSVVNFNIRYNF